MKNNRFLLALFALTACASFAVAPPKKPILAPTPPMGWNSWDSYGTTISEADFKLNVNRMSDRLKAYGWQYAVVDMEWFVTNPEPAGNSKNSQFQIDANGRYVPAENRFPSSAKGAGFKPLADYVHSMGLSFGIHILRGIPKQAADHNLPIADSTFRAGDAADKSDSCPWNPDNYGLDPKKPAAQAYYDSIAKLYAGWGVDLIKVDCIADHPYKGDEIRMLSAALGKTGRPIVLSLSPGPAPIEKTPEMRRYAQMWRISDDVWDMWHSTVQYPQGLGDQFPRVAKWAALSQAGHWPDADMLPLGLLGPAPGWGNTRSTRLTHDEQRTLITLWSMFRSPLMMGGNLTSIDDWTLSLLTNREVLTVDQHSHGNHAEITSDSTVVWTAKADTPNTTYVAVFNLTDAAAPVHYTWKQLKLLRPEYKVRDLWAQKDDGVLKDISATVPPHGCVLYSVAAEP